MPRYIDAYLLSSNIQKYLCSSCSVRCTPFEIKNSACEIAECLRMIYNAPTADVQEVRHDGMDISQNESYWDATDCGSPACNRCGKSPLYYAEVAHVKWNLRHLPRFCSSCGSTMKEVLYSDKSGKVQKLQIP